jgi:hypothetical protein
MSAYQSLLVDRLGDLYFIKNVPHDAISLQFLARIPGVHTPV